jgi:hypothetical protein
MGCLTTQMLHEASTPWDGNPKARPDKQLAPKSQQMADRGARLPQQQEPKELQMPWDDEERNSPHRPNRHS